MVTIDAWHWRRVGGVVAAAALVALSAGCTGGDPAPTTPSTVSTTPTTTIPPPTTTTPPTTAVSTGTDGVPAAAKAHTTAGAEAFVRYFIDEVNRSWTLAAPSRLVGLCATTSKSCAGYKEEANDLLTKQQHYDVAPLSVQTLLSMGAVSGVERFLMTGTQTKAHILDGDGKVIELIPADSARYVYFAKWTAKGWLIEDVKSAA